MIEKTYIVNGMSCIICKGNVERALSSIDGVKHVKVNLLENEATVEFDENKVNDELLAKVIKDNGYSLVLDKKKQFNKDRILMIVSIILTIVLMFVSMSFETSKTMYIQLLLSTIVILLNFGFYKSGFISLFKLKPNMDSLVSLSSFIAYIYSIYGIYKINNYEDSHLYFETAAMVLVIVRIGKYIERNTKTKTLKVIRGLSTLIPMQANLLLDNVVKIIPIDSLKKNDIVRVYPGESIPQDGVIVNGKTTINESMITGESLPLEKDVNDEVIGGTININGTIDVKVTKFSNMTVLSNIINMTKRATMSKIPIERLADSVSKYFVFSVIAISIITFTIWKIINKDTELALNFALSVLVVSCPCALGLATPAAIAVACGRAAKKGVLIKKPEVLEIIPKAKTIIFDKTGTLTKNTLEIVDIKKYDEDFENVLSSLEKTNNHPIAKSIINKYPNGNLKFDTSTYISGEGILAIINNDRYLAGNNKLIPNIRKEDIEFAKENNYSYIAVSKNSRVLGIVYLTDVIRDNAKKAISDLIKRNINPIMCTGDNEIAAYKISKQLGITDFKANVKPNDKNDLLIACKKNGVSMMVGDGVNDAIALTNADVSFTINEASDIANATSDIVLMKSDLNDITFSFDLATKTMRIIKQNLLWALGYNTLLIPIAAGCFYYVFNLKLNPMICSVSMLISSLFVLLNALRINRVYKEDE